MSEETKGLYEAKKIERSIMSKDFFNVNINQLDKTKEGTSYIYSVGEYHALN